MNSVGRPLVDLDDDDDDDPWDKTSKRHAFF